MSDRRPRTLQAWLDGRGTDAPEGPEPVPGPVALFRHLVDHGRFHRDSGIGRIFHPGQVSLREHVPNNSLHVVIEGNRIAAHVDLVSPLGVRPGASSRYSIQRAVAHNLVGMAQDLVSLLRGRQGDHRCELDCEWVLDEVPAAAADAGLLPPEESPWGVQLDAGVPGSLDEARLRAALRTAFARHPVDAEALDVVTCPTDDDLVEARDRLHARAVPVDAWPPLHLCLAHHPAGDVLLLNLNHAAADGFGALQVLRAIAAAYAGADDALDFLIRRDLPVRPASPTTSVLVRRAKRAVECLRDGLGRPARLAADHREQRRAQGPSGPPEREAQGPSGPPEREAQGPSGPPERQAQGPSGHGFHLLCFSADETRRVADATTSATSGVLMAALHLAMGEWNLLHGTPGLRLHVLKTTNLRPGPWSAVPVANFSVTARISTTRRERRGPAAALRAIAAQAARNRAARTGTALLAALERSGLLPMWAKQSTVVLQPLTGNRLVDNALLSSLGQLEEAPSFGPGAGTVNELWFSTPARSPLTLCLGSVVVGGRLHLSFRYPHRLFSPDAARRFAECYRQQVGLVAADPR